MIDSSYLKTSTATRRSTRQAGLSPVAKPLDAYSAHSGRPGRTRNPTQTASTGSKNGVKKCRPVETSRWNYTAWLVSTHLLQHALHTDTNILFSSFSTFLFLHPFFLVFQNIGFKNSSFFPSSTVTFCAKILCVSFALFSFISVHVFNCSFCLLTLM